MKLSFLTCTWAISLAAVRLQAADALPPPTASGIDRMVGYVTVDRTDSASVEPTAPNASRGIDRLIDDHGSVVPTRADGRKKPSGAATLDGADGGTGPAATPPPTASTTGDSFLTRQLQNLYLRKSVFDETAFSNGQLGVADLPAQISFTHPGHGDDSYAIDAGLAYVGLPFRPGGVSWFQIDLGLGAEYHRDSADASEKDLFASGVVFEAGLGNVATSPAAALIKGHAIYKNDHVNDFQSVNGGLDILPVAGFLLIGTVNETGPVQWLAQPFAGVDYESTFDTNNSAQRGRRWLARYGVELSVQPFHGTFLGDSVEATIHLTGFSALATNGVFVDSHWRGYFDGNLSYWFNAKVKNPAHRAAQLGVGVSYQNGDDPESNQKKVDLLTVSLQAKY